MINLDRLEALGALAASHEISDPRADEAFKAWQLELCDAMPEMIAELRAARKMVEAAIYQRDMGMDEVGFVAVCNALDEYERVTR